jgi:hypothetical protein
MNLIKKYAAIFFSCFLIVYSSTSAFAQCEVKNTAFKSGEAISYDLYFNWKFVWMKAGTASMATTASSWQGSPAYRSVLLCTGSKRADNFFVLRDTLTSIVGKNLEPLYYRKGSYEGKNYTVDEAYYSYKNGVSNVRQRRFKKGKYVNSSFNDKSCIYDMLSILAYARSLNIQNFKDGQKMYVPMATGKRVDVETLTYRGKKNIKAENDTTYRSLVFEVASNKDGKKLITFYITDDENHLPIRLDLYLNFGSAKAMLHSVRGYRHPLTSIVSR